MALPQEILNYFDTAVIVDDEWDDLWKKARSKQEYASVTLFKAFQQAGFIVSPIKYLPRKGAAITAANVAKVVKQIQSAKLVILDWRLNGKLGVEDEDKLLADPTLLKKHLSKSILPSAANSELQSGPAKAILKALLEEPDMGMKYVVVYTSDVNTGSASPHKLLEYLSDNLTDGALKSEAQRLRSQFAQHTLTPGQLDDEPIVLGNLIITFMDKSRTGEQVFEEFTARLQTLSGPFSLAFLGSVSLIERSTHRALQDFSRPFDVPVFMHVLHNNPTPAGMTSFMVSLIRDYTLDTLEDEHFDGFIHTLIHQKLSCIKECAAFVNDPAKWATWCGAINGAGLDRLDAVIWEVLFADLGNCDDIAAVWDILKTKSNADLLPERYFRGVKKKEKPKVWEQAQLNVELLIAYQDWARRSKGRSVDEFLNDYRMQNVLFTRLQKFTNARKTLFTGAIYRRKGTDSEQFLVCITPYCDTARPEKVDHNYKFLVGSSEPFDKDLRKLKESEHRTFIPCGELGHETLEMVTWSFYQTMVFKINEPAAAVQEWRNNGYSLQWFQQNLEALRSYIALDSAEVQRALQHLFMKDSTDSTKEPLFADPKVATALHYSPQAWAQLPQSSLAMEDIDRILTGTDFWKFEDNYTFVRQLKKEYVQQIINEYVMYHSRAGVPELYFKEHSQLLGLLKA